MSKPRVDLVIANAAQALTLDGAGGDLLGSRRGVDVAIAGETIAALAPRAALEAEFDLSGAAVIDATGKILAPGFVDCHTHLVFGGSRAQEYAARLTHTAQEVAALGIPSGIQATLHMTRSSDPAALAAAAAQRLHGMLRSGTTTAESKSGYGLSLAKEIELLRINRALQASQPVDIVSTFLGAHDFPPEIPRQRYLDALLAEMIPQAAENGLAEFCDVYCDAGYYSVAESRRILETGLRYGLRAKIHVDAYANLGGSELAAELPVVSADHLNYTTPGEVTRLARAGVVGVVMPGLDFAVNHPHPFDARRALDQGMTLALATDLCPACYLESMQLVIQLACRLYRFTPAEALVAATRGAAAALGLSDRAVLAPGKLADIQVWDLPSFEDLVYRLGNNAVTQVIKRGRLVEL